MEEKMEEQSYQQPIQEEQVPQAQPEQVAPISANAPTQDQTNQPMQAPEVEVEAPAAPATEAEAPTQEPAQAEPTQQYAQEPVQQAEQTADDGVELDTLPNYGQTPELQPFDWSNLPQDVDGNIDPNAFAAAINQQITQATEVARQQARMEAQEQIKEQKLWEQAENSYPELKQDKELRDMVKNARWGEWVATNGQKNPSPKAIADKIFNKIGKAKQMGVEQAQNNVRIQESAVLETASNTATSNPQSELRTRVASANSREQRDTATTELLKTLIDSGDIKIGE
jgi:hypothetical protein